MNSSAVHEPTGGNPDGFLKWDDDTSGSGGVLAPAKFLGDLSAFVDGLVSMDLNAISRSPSHFGFDPPYGKVIFKDTGGNQIVADLNGLDDPAEGVWISSSAPLNPSEGWLFNGPSPATASEIALVLGSVDQIRVFLDWSIGFSDVSGFDNFIITNEDSAIPIPATLPLLLTGLAGLSLIGWRRRKTA